jgi:hypothetical protein
MFPPKRNTDALFAGLIFAVAVLLGVLLWYDGTLVIPFLAENSAYRTAPAAPAVQPVSEPAMSSGAVSETPPLPSDFPPAQATSTIAASDFAHVPLSLPTSEVPGLKIFSMSASADGFAPSVLVLSVGDRVQLNVTASGDRFDLGIPKLGAYIEIPGGEERSVSFDVSASGTYPFFCRAYCPGGRELSGTIVVR